VLFYRERGWFGLYPQGCEHLQFWAKLRKGSLDIVCYYPAKRRVVGESTFRRSRGHYWLEAGWENFMADFIRKSLARAATVGQGGGCRDRQFTTDYPGLTEFMTCTSDEGTPRQTATLNVSWGDGEFRAFLNDRHSRQSLCVVSDTFWGLLEALEGRIASDDPGWRQMLSDGSTSRRKKT